MVDEFCVLTAQTSSHSLSVRIRVPIAQTPTQVNNLWTVNSVDCICVWTGRHRSGPQVPHCGEAPRARETRMEPFRPQHVTTGISAMPRERRSSGDPEHDLADIRAALHQPVRGCRLGKRKDLRGRRAAFALTFGGWLITVAWVWQAVRGRKESLHEEDSHLTLHLVAAPGRSGLADLPLVLLRPDDPGVHGKA